MFYGVPCAIYEIEFAMAPLRKSDEHVNVIDLTIALFAASRPGLGAKRPDTISFVKFFVIFLIGVSVSR